MNRTIIYCSLALALTAVSSCGGKNGEKKEADLARADYRPESNPVDVVVLREVDFPMQLASNGKLHARRKSILSLKASGQVVVLNAENGSRVDRGDIIAVVDTTELHHSRVQAEEALEKATLELLRALIDHGYQTIADTAILPQDISRTVSLRSGYPAAQASLEAARRNLDNAYLRAPFSGKVASVKFRMYENASGEFCTLIDDGAMEAEFNILESEQPFVSMGQQVKIATYNAPDSYVTGRITQINPMVDEKGLIKITAQVGNDGAFIDGMNVKVLVENMVPGQWAVPKDAVVIRDNHDVLFRVMNGRAAWTYVIPVMTNSSSHVVRANTDRGAELNLGDTIIISGNMNLADGSYIEITN